MLLAIDIGNTNINCAIFKGNKIIKRFAIPTKEYGQQKLKSGLGKIKIEEAIFCSVVPEINNTVQKDIGKLIGKKPLIVGKDNIVPIKNRYRNPKQVGQDRLVNAYAGLKIYGAPLIIVDFGTAVTFDIVSKKGEYLGGIIAPGLNLSLKALAKNTALLPKITLSRPKELVGRDTRQSMLSGAVFGMSVLTDGLILRLKGILGPTAKVVATGGDSPLMKSYCRQTDIVDNDLTLKGLKKILDKPRLV